MHHIKRAIVPPLPLSPLAMFVNTPVIGIIKQPKKKTPCIISKYFSHLSAAPSAFMDNPTKKVDNAIIPYPSKS